MCRYRTFDIQPNREIPPASASKFLLRLCLWTGMRNVSRITRMENCIQHLKTRFVLDRLVLFTTSACIRVRALSIMKLSVMNKAQKVSNDHRVTWRISSQGSKLTKLLCRHKISLLYLPLVLLSPFYSFCFPARPIIWAQFWFQYGPQPLRILVIWERNHRGLPLQVIQTRQNGISRTWGLGYRCWTYTDLFITVKLVIRQKRTGWGWALCRLFRSLWMLRASALSRDFCCVCSTLRADRETCWRS